MKWTEWLAEFLGEVLHKVHVHVKYDSCDTYSLIRTVVIDFRVIQF